MQSTEQTVKTVLNVPRRCGGCGYALTGLGASGVCPECAYPFSESELILYGWSAGNSATFATGSPKSMKWLWIGIAFFAVINLDKAIMYVREDNFLYAACALGIIVVIGFHVWRRASISSGFGMNAKLLLSPEGYSQVASNTKFRIARWKLQDRIELSALPAGIRIQVHRSVFIGITTLVDFEVHSAEDIRSWCALVANITSRGVLVKPSPGAL